MKCFRLATDIELPTLTDGEIDNTGMFAKNMASRSTIWPGWIASGRTVQQFARKSHSARTDILTIRLCRNLQIKTLGNLLVSVFAARRAESGAIQAARSSAKQEIALITRVIDGAVHLWAVRAILAAYIMAGRQSVCTQVPSGAHKVAKLNRLIKVHKDRRLAACIGVCEVSITLSRKRLS